MLLSLSSTPAGHVDVLQTLLDARAAADPALHNGVTQLSAALIVDSQPEAGKGFRSVKLLGLPVFRHRSLHISHTIWERVLVLA